MMFRMFGVVLVAIVLHGCGVETSSSVSNQDTVVNPGTTNNQPNNNTTNPDTNTSNGDNKTTNPSDKNTTISSDPCKEDCLYDKVDALYDANGCDANLYRIASDASFNGDLNGENGATFTVVDGQGLEINSEHNEADSSNAYKTWVTLFYKTFPDLNSLGNQGYKSYNKKGVFFLSYDLAWSDKSIGGIDNTVYIRSMKNAVEGDSSKKPSCYRVTLNGNDADASDVQKVFR